MEYAKMIGDTFSDEEDDYEPLEERIFEAMEIISSLPKTSETIKVYNVLVYLLNKNF